MTPPHIETITLLEAAVETTASVCLALRPDHTIMLWNRAAEELYGVPRAQAYGLDYVARFIAPEQQAAVAADIRKVLAGEPTWQFEDDSVLTDGTRRTLVWNVCRVLDAQGEPCGIIAAGHDISARKEAERTFRLVWDHSTEGLLIGGGPGIIDCNPAALAMLGLSNREQLIGRHPMEFSPAVQPNGTPSAQQAKINDALTRERGEHRFPWTHQRTDGTLVPTDVHVRRARLAGRPVTVIAWVDRSEQTAIAEREAALRTQLLRAQKLDALGHLAGGIAHDFNNLLAAIRGSLDLAMLDLAPDSSAATELSIAQETTSRAASLVRQLLTFGRQREAALEVFDLAAFVRSTELMLRRLLPAHSTLILDVLPDSLFVYGDRTQLEQVLVNLVVNARDAMPAGGVVTVRLTAAGASTARCARLEVIDTGKGMSADVLDRVFDPFFTTKPVGSGSGLGLSVVYGIVSAHDGIVNVESEVGVGTVVRADLPQAESPAAPVESIVDDADAVRVRPGSVATILVVEDEPSVRGALRRLLEREGYAVLEATHGAEALTVWYANGAEVRAVLSDVRMPIMTGPEFVRLLRATGSRTPVVLMSGFADSELVRALPEGVTEVLSKPFHASDLLRAVGAAVALGEGAVA